MSENSRVAKTLYDISEIYTIKGDRFKSRAYGMASQRVTALTEDIRAVHDRGELTDIPGVGKSIAMTITEVLDTGTSTVLQELRDSLPRGVTELINIEGIGPKIATRLNQELGVDSIQALEQAAKLKRIRALKGFGPRKEENILKAITEHRARSTRFLLGEVLPTIQGILAYMRASTAVRLADVAGSARRMKETVGDLDVLVSSTTPEEVSARFIEMPPVARILAHGATKSQVVLENGLQVDLRVVPPESYGAALQYFTGSKEHNVKLRTISVKAGYKLNEYGLYRRDTDELVAAEDERDIYNALGMDWMPPELRENGGEIEAATQHTLPNLVTTGDIQGDLHIHTDYSHAAGTLEEMIEKAAQTGHRYMAVTDHSQSLVIARGLKPDKLMAQVNEVRRLDEQHPEIKVLTGTECDILRDGSLDYPDELLAELDWVIASIHTGFQQDEETITQRTIKAIHNPHVKAIGHPTGRLIQQRSPYPIDLEKVYQAAAEQNVLLEINANPHRLDLRDVDARRAKEAGAKLCIGTDAHNMPELDYMLLGVAVSRRAWLEPVDLANTWSVEEVLGFRR